MPNGNYFQKLIIQWKYTHDIYIMLLKIDSIDRKITFTE